jgi:Cytochrome P460
MNTSSSSSWFVVLTLLAGAGGCAAVEPTASTNVAPIYGIALPAGYREFRLVSVAREEGSLDDLRAVLGNDLAFDAYRRRQLPFPDGATIVRIAWSYVPSAENNAAFGRVQSFVAGEPKNGVQFMVKDSVRYPTTSGWGFAQFDDGRPASEKVHATCYPCHEAGKTEDLVFTRYAR